MKSIVASISVFRSKIKRIFSVGFLTMLLFFSAYTAMAGSLPFIAQADNGTAICTPGTNGIGTCVNRIYVISLAAGGFIAIILIIVAGYLYMSGGEGVKTAKKLIVSAISGLVILFGTFALLNTINPDLTNFTGLTLPDLTCGGANGTTDAGKNLCAAPNANLINSDGSTASSATSKLAITAGVSGNKNVGLQAQINGKDGGTFTQYTSWVWTDNGQAMIGSGVTTADVDTSLDDNSPGPKTDAVTVTATGSGVPTLSASATINSNFDANGDALSATVSNQASSGGSGNGAASGTSQAAAQQVLADNGSGSIILGAPGISGIDCKGNYPLKNVTDISNGNTTEFDGPGTICGAGQIQISSSVLSALNTLAQSNLKVTVTSLTSGHHQNSSDPHYKGLAVDVVPDRSSQDAVVSSFYSNGASEVAEECNYNGGATHAFIVVDQNDQPKTGQSSLSVCSGGSYTNGYHIHAQWSS